MPKLKTILKYDLIGEIRSFWSIKPFEHIIPWAEKNINFSDDVSAERDSLDFEKFCYQIDPIKEWEDLNSIKKVTVVMPQQGRKNKLLYCWSALANGL